MNLGSRDWLEPVDVTEQNHNIHVQIQRSYDGGDPYTSLAVGIALEPIRVTTRDELRRFIELNGLLAHLGTQKVTP